MMMSKSVRLGPSARTIEYDAGSVIGQVVPRLSGQLQKTSRIRIVLKLQTYNNMTYYILTAYPVL